MVVKHLLNRTSRPNPIVLRIPCKSVHQAHLVASSGSKATSLGVLVLGYSNYVCAIKFQLAVQTGIPRIWGKAGGNSNLKMRIPLVTASLEAKLRKLGAEPGAAVTLRIARCGFIIDNVIWGCQGLGSP